MAAENCLCKLLDRGSVESHRLFRARKTVFEMLRDRGYSVSDNDLSMTLPHFRELYGEEPDTSQLTITTAMDRDPSQRIMVLFCAVDAAKLAHMREYIKQILNEKVHDAIIVYRNSMTPQARIAIKEMPSPYSVELFQMSDLLVNITEHVLKPKHDILTPEEKDELLKKYSVTDNQLPRMLQTDAISRYYGLKPGQIVKITYSDEPIESFMTYRCVN